MQPVIACIDEIFKIQLGVLQQNAPAERPAATYPVDKDCWQPR
jgi:hypothetical protein